MTSRPLACVPRSSTGIRELIALADRLARSNVHERGVAIAHDQALEQPEVIDPAQHEPGIAVQRPLGGPLGRIRHRQHGVTIDDVVGQDRQGFQVHRAAVDGLEFPVQDRSRGRLALATRRFWSGAGRRSARTTISTGPGPASQFWISSITSRAPASGGIRCKPSFSNTERSASRDHAARPRAPVERDDATVWQRCDGRPLPTC